MIFPKMNAYGFGIIISLLTVLCVCDENVTMALANSERKPPMENEGHLCHREEEDCGQCCEFLECFKGICTNCLDDTGTNICGATPYEAASQISLSIAMALGVIILLVVLWKMCFYDPMSPFRRYSRRARARMIANSETPRSEDVTRASASSIQNRIIARLQNRPPRYESSYNYNQRVEASKQQAVIDEAPPSYDAVEENLEKGPPPPYTIDLEASTRQGRDNNSFIGDDPLSGNTRTTTIDCINTNTSLNTENTVETRGVTVNGGTVHI